MSHRPQESPQQVPFDRAEDVRSAEAEKPCLAESQPAASGLGGAHTAASLVKVFDESISLGNVLEELMGK